MSCEFRKCTVPSVKSAFGCGRCVFEIRAASDQTAADNMTGLIEECILFADFAAARNAWVELNQLVEHFNKASKHDKN